MELKRINRIKLAQHIFLSMSYLISFAPSALADGGTAANTGGHSGAGNFINNHNVGGGNNNQIGHNNGNIGNIANGLGNITNGLSGHSSQNIVGLVTPGPVIQHNPVAPVAPVVQNLISNTHNNFANNNNFNLNNNNLNINTNHSNTNFGLSQNTQSIGNLITGGTSLPTTHNQNNVNVGNLGNLAGAGSHSSFNGSSLGLNSGGAFGANNINGGQHSPANSIVSLTGGLG
ncbi:MAG: hypothetical protein K2X81_03205, partial [Candidatus Obscuribacterales bacterium]|nr:hypothetical protein [Candidatus Obscuribacterales bacterium]